MYDPLIGKFTSPDPIIGDEGDSQAWNPYAYSHNNPMSQSDPTGLAGGDDECNAGCLYYSGAGAAGGAWGQAHAPQPLYTEVGANGQKRTDLTIQQATAAYANGDSLGPGVRGDIASYVAGQLGISLSSLLPSSSGHSTTASGKGGDGHPDSDFKRDAKGNLVYSDELSGKYSSCDCLTLTSGYHDARDGTNFHGGIDLAPSQHDADALSVTSGTVVRIGANGFGNSAVIVRTPEGNWATYGHLESNSVRLNDPVNVGNKIGIMGTKGFSTGVHLHFQVTTGQMFGAGSQFLGVTGP